MQVSDTSLTALRDSLLQQSQKQLAIASTDVPTLVARGHDDRMQYRATGNMASLLRAVATLEAALVAAGDSSESHASALEELGCAYRDEHRRDGSSAPLERSIDLLEQAVALTPEGTPELSRRLSMLGRALRDRYDCDGKASDLKRALILCRRAVRQCSAFPETLPLCQANLGLSLEDEFARRGGLPVLEQAISLHSTAVAGSSPTAPDFPFFLNNLGRVLETRYAILGQSEDLERSIAAHERAVLTTPSGAPDLPIHIGNLGLGLLDRYARSGDSKDQQRAIELLEHSLALSPLGSRYRSGALNSLSVALTERLSRWKRATDPEATAGSHTIDGAGHLADLNRITELLEEALSTAPKRSPDRTVVMNNLAVQLADRSGFLGSEPELDRAIRLHEQLLVVTPEASPYRAGRLNNLATALRSRYRRSGDVVDLERAITLLRAAVQRTPVEAPDHPMFLSNLGDAFDDRYLRTNDASDLDQALSLACEAERLTSIDSPTLHSRLNSVGHAIMRRFRDTGETRDLDMAYEVQQLVEELTPPSSAARGDALIYMIDVLEARFRRDGVREDIDRAIRLCEEVLRLRQQVAFHHDGALVQFAALYRLRQDPGDLDRALSLQQQAVRLTPRGSPRLPNRLDSLGSDYLHRHATTARLYDLTQALKALDKAERVLRTSFSAAPVAYKLAQQDDIVGIYVRLVSVLCDIARAPVGSARRVAALQRALEVVESSKSRVLTEIVGREVIPAPAGIVPAQLARERDLLSSLSAIDKAELADRGSVPSVADDALFVRAKQRHQARRQLRRVWNTMVRQTADATDYVALRRGDTPTWADMRSLAASLGSDTALLSMFTTWTSTLAFIVRVDADYPILVKSEFSGDDWIEARRRLKREVEPRSDAVATTWDRTFRSFLDQVGPHLDGIHRIIISPERTGHRIPWAAALQRAGLTGPTGRPLAVSVVPTLGILNYRLLANSSERSGSLIVGNPEGDLKHAEREARMLAPLLGSKALIGEHATKKAVLSGLATARIAHLAGHAYYSHGDPLESGIRLADGVLTAREVLVHHAALDLVVLAACQSGMTASLAGEEVFGLAEAFLCAGTRAVVVSLWDVDDPASAAFMRAFYGSWQSGKMVAEALAKAMERLQSDMHWRRMRFWGGFMVLGDGNQIRLQ